MADSNQQSETGFWPGSASPETGSFETPVVPGYELFEELGRGGMGVVFRAKHIERDQVVALKLMRDGALAGVHERARFRIEAEAASRVRHVHVVEILDVGEHRGLPYFAMEFIDGGSLDRLIAGRSMDARQSAQLIHTIATAVHHAHSQNVVHRDLKPGNILLVKSESGKLHPKIADFGLAKRLDAESTGLTRDGAVLGTLGYMAPEQAAGRLDQIGPACDIYALGAILYELLTGRPPFQSDSRDRTLAQVLNDDPIPVTRIDVSIPRDLETIAMKCLEKEIPNRYASPRDLADDLTRFLEGSPVVAVAVSDWKRVTRAATRDGYSIQQEVGRGPCSVVYKASYGSLQQPVAVKLFDAGTCSKEQWDERLKNGAEVHAGLSHPGLVPIRGAGWWIDRPFVVTDFLPQGSIPVPEIGKPIPIRPILELVERIGDVICYLHRQGVVHGNLKPANVLLAADGIPRLVDPHRTGGRHIVSPPNHNHGLRYLAPELLDDASAEPRQHTDVYGFGLLLYELATGHSAIPDDDPDAVKSREPIPPSHLNPLVDAPFEAMVQRCLRKYPWSRYPRAFDVVKRVRYLLNERR